MKYANYAKNNILTYSKTILMYIYSGPGIIVLKPYNYTAAPEPLYFYHTIIQRPLKHCT